MQQQQQKNGRSSRGSRSLRTVVTTAAAAALLVGVLAAGPVAALDTGRLSPFQNVEKAPNVHVGLSQGSTHVNHRRTRAFGSSHIARNGPAGAGAADGDGIRRQQKRQQNNAETILDDTILEDALAALIEEADGDSDGDGTITSGSVRRMSTVTARYTTTVGGEQSEFMLHPGPKMLDCLSCDRDSLGIRADMFFIVRSRRHARQYNRSSPYTTSNIFCKPIIARDCSIRSLLSSSFIFDAGLSARL